MRNLERIRTSDLCLRRVTLYPAELRALYEKQKFTRFVEFTGHMLTDLAKFLSSSMSLISQSRQPINQALRVSSQSSKC